MVGSDIAQNKDKDDDLKSFAQKLWSTEMRFMFIERSINLEMQVMQPKRGVNCDFKYYAKQLTQQFNLLP